MNDNFSAIWHSQELFEHDDRKLKATWRKQRTKNILTNFIAILAIPIVIWLGFNISVSDSHWSVKSWVIFWSVFCCGYCIYVIWALRSNIKSLTEYSSNVLISQMLKSTKYHLKAARLAKVIAILMVMMLIPFNIAYVPLGISNSEEWLPHIAKMATILSISIFVWVYSTKKSSRLDSELKWLYEEQKRRDGTT